MIALLMSTDWGKQNKYHALFFGMLGDIAFAIMFINFIENLH